MYRPGDGTKIYDHGGLEFWQRTIKHSNQPLIGPQGAYLALELEPYNIAAWAGGTLKNAANYQWYAMVSLSRQLLADECVR